MAFFKFRKAADDTTAAAPAESVEVMRRRARHRLIGATVLVLVGVVGFPLLFETQPRPVQVDIPIDIPDRAKAKPLAAAPAAAAAATSAPVAAGPVSGPVTPAAPAAPAPAPKVAAAESLDPKEEIVAAKPAPKPAASAPVAAAKPEAKPEPKPEPKTAAAAKPDDGARAKALLEGKPVAATTPAAADGGRYVVQVGAFADADKARETRLKVERAGLKTYTHVAETKDGKRIRVRVGPFTNRAEADRAADKIKGLDLPAAILTL